MENKLIELYELLTKESLSQLQEVHVALNDFEQHDWNYERSKIAGNYLQ